jgi:hypothetical protein
MLGSLEKLLIWIFKFAPLDLKFAPFFSGCKFAALGGKVREKVRRMPGCL